MTFFVFFSSEIRGEETDLWSRAIALRNCFEKSSPPPPSLFRTERPPLNGRLLPGWTERRAAGGSSPGALPSWCVCADGGGGGMSHVTRERLLPYMVMFRSSGWIAPGSPRAGEDAGRFFSAVWNFLGSKHSSAADGRMWRKTNIFAASSSFAEEDISTIFWGETVLFAESQVSRPCSTEWNGNVGKFSLSLLADARELFRILKKDFTSALLPCLSFQ